MTDPQTRIASLTAALQEAEAKLAMVTESADYFARGGHKGDCTAYADNPSSACDCGWLDLHHALAATDPDVAAFLARVKRQGAAEELRAWSVSTVGEMARLLDQRAAELEANHD